MLGLEGEEVIRPKDLKSVGGSIVTLKIKYLKPTKNIYQM